MVAKRAARRRSARSSRSWDLEAAVDRPASPTTASAALRWRGEEVAAICRSRPLTDDAPVYRRPADEPAPARRARSARPPHGAASRADHGAGAAARCSPRPNLARKRVDLPPVRPDRAAATRCVRPGRRRRGACRVEGTRPGLALTVDCNGRYCCLDPVPGRGAWPWPRPRATSSASARGRSALTDCLNFGNPERPEIMWQFQQAIARHRATPAARSARRSSRGNVSFYNETEGVEHPADAHHRDGRHARRRRRRP